MNDAPQSQLILYRTPDGQTRIQCRFENENIWLTQALMAELFQKDVRTINEHLMNIFQEGELNREATIRKFRIVRREGARDVARTVNCRRRQLVRNAYRFGPSAGEWCGASHRMLRRLLKHEKGTRTDIDIHL